MDLIFDLDGCLIDSGAVQKAAFFGSYAEVVGDDRCPSYEEYIRHTGESLDNVLRILGLPPEMAGPYRRISRELVDEVRVNREAAALIADLRVWGVKTAICTGKDRDRTEELLHRHGLAELFDALVCSGDVARPKPSPEPVLAALRALGDGPEEALMIGDGYNDILSARAAGVPSVLTLWYGDSGVPREADYTVSTVIELKSLLNRLNSRERAGVEESNVEEGN